MPDKVTWGNQPSCPTVCAVKHCLTSKTACMKETGIDFGSTSVSLLFRRVFFPTLFGMLGMSAMTAIDGIFIGHCVGADGIAAINIIVPILMLLTGVGLMVGAGCSVTASVHLARGHVLAARLGLTRALLFVTLVAVVVVTPMLVFPDATARFLGSSEHLLPFVKEYMVWYVPSWVFMLWTAVALFMIRLDGAPNIAMACSLVAAVLNIVLDWLFMFPFGWGLMGGALATSLSTAAGSLIAVVYLLRFARRLRVVPFRLHAKGLRLAVRDVAAQCCIGSSSLLAEATMAVLIFLGNIIFMRYLGDPGVGAFGIACYYAPFIFMVGNAVAQSAQPIISYNFAAGHAARVRQAEATAIRAALLCGLVVTAAFLLFPGWLVGLFLDTRETAARLAIQGFPLFACGFIPFIFNITAVGYFQSVERVRPATTFALFRGVILLVPAFLLVPRLFGTPGIWLSMPVAETLTALSVVVFYLLGRRRALS